MNCARCLQPISPGSRMRKYCSKRCRDDHQPHPPHTIGPSSHACHHATSSSGKPDAKWCLQLLKFVSEKLRTKSITPFRSLCLQILLPGLLVPPRVAIKIECAECLSLKLQCANCYAPLMAPSDLSITARIFCSEKCQQEAKFVRYVRSTLRDGRFERNDVQEAIGVKAVMVLGGGYPTRARSISKTRRAEVFARDGSVCQLCGAPGNEIDHITGSSADLENLRVLCGDCNKGRLIVTTDDGAEAVIDPLDFPSSIIARILSSIPAQMCDDENAWASSWRALASSVKREWMRRSLDHA